MDITPKIPTALTSGYRLRGRLSVLALALSVVLLVATYFLMSPPPGETYPGAIPWRAGSILKGVTDLMSLYGVVATVRGVEIKDFALHLATVVALVLLAARALVSGLLPPDRRTAKGAWFLAQAFLAAWVLLSLASNRWSGDPNLSLGQGTLYGLALAWAVALSWCLEGRDVPRLLWGYVVIATLGAALCVWYFYARNPYHNPGFPIGNPNSLAACTLPAVLIVGAGLVGSIWTTHRAGRLPPWSRVISSALVLVPLCWCFWLTQSLGARVGLLIGIAGLLFLRMNRRVRWAVLSVVVVLGAVGAAYASYAHPDLVMSRGPTIRFRVYAWRYAAILWSQQPFAGSGAGQYPCQANFYAALTDDRVLDPAAFPAEMVEHAHNELFEVFAEIGLVGGVTFVAGLLATLAAASALLRTSLSPERRWLLYGLVAAVIALLADAMFGVGLRLPGLPAVFYTLLGVLWAACRSVSKQRSTEASVSDVWLRRMVVRRYGLAAVALLSAALATRAMLRNWTGVRAEWSGQAAQRAGQWEAALASTRLAEARLLDPVRKLIANMHAVDCEFARARGNFGQAAAALAERDAVHPEGDGTSSTPAAAPELLRAAVSDCRAAYDAAFALSRRAPNLGRMAAVGAQCAEMLATMYSRVGDSKQAGVWGIRALQAWRSQRALRSFDVQTLLALTRYPALTGDYIGLLRDTLRAGFPPREWYGALQSRTRTRDFEQTLAAMIQAVGPYNPQTELNTLIISRKPEMYRLSGAWKALRGDYESAASDAARAARLYEPMRPRFPELYSVVLAEQAEYMLGAHPEEPGRAAALLREAIRALPAMQSQKYAEMAAPYRLRLARVLAEMSAADEAATLLQTVLDVWPADRTAWGLTVGMAVRRGDAEAVRAALRAAEEAGLPARDLEHIRQVVRERMPEAFETRRDE